MSLRINELAGHALAYTPAVLDELEVGRRVAAIQERLVAAMKAGKISQNALEEASGVDQPTISRILRGSVPELPTLIRLLDGLRIPLSDFCREIETPHKDFLLKSTAALSDNRGSPSQSGSAIHATESSDPFARAAESFAAHIVAYVRRELAQGQRPATSARPKRTARRRRVHRRKSPGS